MSGDVRTATSLAGGSVQREFRVMGCRSFVVVHGGDERLLDTAEARLRELESWWSRFLDDSDITRANRAAGRPVVVHEDTLAVVARSVLAWRQTEGRFDITMLPALLQQGYTHSTTTHAAAPSVPGLRVGMSSMISWDYDASTLTVPANAAIDLGGIGKGMAADIVAEELIEAGATGVVVNVGGDFVVLGTPSEDASWYVGIEDPRNPPAHVAVLRLQTGGMASSGTTIRNWQRPDGTTAHHLIDPTSLRPSASGVMNATVLAADAATAEAFATAAMMLPGPEAMAMLDTAGLAGLAVGDDGTVYTSSRLKDFSA
jgi:thiamine biosynthesis lipoprotein